MFPGNFPPSRRGAARCALPFNPYLTGGVLQVVRPAQTGLLAHPGASISLDKAENPAGAI